jgi:transcriptional regulator with XRE-family HTH domain
VLGGVRYPEPVEHGHRQPTVKTLGKLARALGVEARDLFS